MADSYTSLLVCTQGKSQANLQCAGPTSSLVSAAMSGFGQRVKDRREELGLSQTELGTAAGLTYQAIQQIEDGSTKSSRRLLELAKALNTSPDWLVYGDEKERPIKPAKMPPSTKIAPEIETNVGERVPYPAAQWPLDLPVKGTAECGPDGWSLFNGDTSHMAPRPPWLAGVTTAYAVYARGNSMEPRYHDGELLHVHPGKPVQIENYVLVQIKPLHEGDPPRALIKRLERRSGSKITLRQFNPNKTIDLKVSEVISIHKIVGTGEG